MRAIRVVTVTTSLIAMLAIADAGAQQLEVELTAEGIPVGYVLHGDIQVREGIRTPFDPELWPSGVVPYQFDLNVSLPQRIQAEIAMAEWEQVSSLNFVPRSGQDDHVHIRDFTANSSPVGRQGGQQIINIVSWGEPIVIAHELGHTVGLYHEQSRLDRDTYVEIIWDNIDEGQEHNFEVAISARAYGPYDFDSCMHYGICFFSICAPGVCPPSCQTIRARPGYTQYESLMGNRDHLSEWDQRTMSFLYPPPCTTFLDRDHLSLATPDGSVLRPYITFADAYSAACAGGALWILRSGLHEVNYPVSFLGRLDRAMTIRAADQAVRLVP